MKYLKRFNESNSYEEELRDFCETSLAYLADKGYNVKVVNVGKNQNDYFHITIKYEYGGDEQKKEIRWLEIKDHFIPFYKILNRRYIMLRLFTCGRNYQWGKLHYEVKGSRGSWDYTNSFTSNYKVGGDPNSCSLSWNNPNTIINNIPDNQIVSQILIDIV